MTKELLRQEIQRGFGSAERPVIKVLWEREKRGTPSAVHETGNHEPARLTVNYKRYYDRDYAEREYERLWTRSWLFACREEDIPEIGDRTPFRVGRLDFLIVRTGEDSFKAFYNSCTHRGTRLCDATESGSVIRCPYHAWEWKIDGALKRIPSHWDFKTVTRANAGLREIRLERWGGCIFINADRDAEPLIDALGPIPQHFEGYGIERRYTAGWFRKHVMANWKIAQEAFLESYHVIGTHPQAVPYNGDSQTQYDIWTTRDGAVGRQSTPSAVPSMHAAADATPLNAANIWAQSMKAWHYPDAKLPVLDPQGDPRAQIAAWHRKVQKETYGRDCSKLSEAAMIDSLLYFIFPSSCLWLSESLPFTYSFTPHPTEPEQSYFEVRMLLPVPEGQKKPKSCPRVDVSPDQHLADLAPAFNLLGTVFDQDMDNMPRVQYGMRAADPARAYGVLGTYQESLMQQWHDLLDRYLAD